MPDYKSWPETFVEKPVDDIIKMYEDGYVGSYQDEAAEDDLRDFVTYAEGADAAHAYGFADSGKDKLVFPIEHVMDVYPKCLPGPSQSRGSCFPPGNKVLMKDGTKKSIEDIEVNDRVVTHLGNIKKVYETIKKPCEDELINISVKGYPKNIKCTKDHIFFILRDKDSVNLIEKRADELTTDDWLILGKPSIEEKSVEFDLKNFGATITDDIDFKSKRLIPVKKGYCRAPKSSSHHKRFIQFDENFAYLLGAYLAEGHVKLSSNNGNEVVFSLSAKEEGFKNKICSKFKKVFDVSPVIRLVNSRKSVMSISVPGKAIARLFFDLAGGKNAYTKKVTNLALQLNQKSKLNLIQGWIDGDGYYKDIRKDRNNKFYPTLEGYTVSQDLATGMQQLCNSCGLRSIITTRKARGHSKKSYVLELYGDNALQLKKQDFANKYDLKFNNNPYGTPIKIKDITQEHYNGDVFCINVEDDHSFICEGISVHNCVADSATITALGTMVLESVLGIPDAVTGRLEECPKVSLTAEKNRVLAFEPVYWYRRHGGDGWSCGAASKVLLNECGAIIRKDYSDTLGVNLEKYSGKIAGKYGRNPPPRSVGEHLDNNLFREATFLSTFEEVRDFLNRGFFIMTCGGESWSSKRDNNGFSERTRKGWAHALTLIAADDRPMIKQEYGEPLVLVQNSWGIWNTGGRKVLGTNKQIPHGSYWSKWSDFKRRQMIAIGGLNGWERKELPDLSPGAV